MDAAAGAGIERVVHIGDSLHYDVAGALNAGAGAVWVRQNPAAATAEEPVDLSAAHQVAAFPDLLRLIDLNGKASRARPIS